MFKTRKDKEIERLKKKIEELELDLTNRPQIVYRRGDVKTLKSTIALIPEMPMQIVRRRIASSLLPFIEQYIRIEVYDSESHPYKEFAGYLDIVDRKWEGL